MREREDTRLPDRLPTRLAESLRRGAPGADGSISVDEAEQAVRTLLRFIGEDPEREGLRETPRRYVNALLDMTTGPGFTATTFDAEGHDQIVVQRAIPFTSLCEHHVLPFFGTATVAYLPGEGETARIVGLSKLARLVHYYARRLQNQERITGQVADALLDATGARGVAVVLEARHLCMELRGARTPGASTVTSAMRGAFLTDDGARAEVLALHHSPLPR